MVAGLNQNVAKATQNFKQALQQYIGVGVAIQTMDDQKYKEFFALKSRIERETKVAVKFVQQNTSIIIIGQK